MLKLNQHTVAKMSDADYLEYWKSRCVISSDGCWEWQGSMEFSRGMRRSTRGYPQGFYRGKHVRLTRAVVAITQRPLLETELALHRCDNPPCINPAHLWIGTQRDNKLDEIAKGRNFYLNRSARTEGQGK